jgi:hypothetical protein
LSPCVLSFMISLREVREMKACTVSPIKKKHWTDIN